jgi:8-oxo-dGTP pyrophosphatase MutT (NUDIX family)
MGTLGWDEVRGALVIRPPVRMPEAGQRAAVAMILKEGESGLEVLFIQRAEHPEDPWSGHVGFPGGRAEAADNDLTITAIRETVEEIGIDLAAEAELLGSLDEIRAMARMRPVDLVITPYVFRLRSGASPRLSAEVVGVHWLRLSDLLDPAHRSVLDYAHQESTLRFPCLRLGGLVIWGLTYRMFLGFEELLAAGNTSGSGR